MITKTIIVVSGLVDATVKEYQPDVDFRIFKSVEDLGNYLDTNPLRASSMYITKDVVGAANATFSYLRKLVVDNDYLVVDNVVYLTEEDSSELESLNYLIEEFGLNNWEIITGSMSRAFVTEIINGTFRGDKMDVKRKAVYRKPRAEYVKSQLKNYNSLDEDYADDEHDLAGIPDVEIPKTEIPMQEETLRFVRIAGLDNYERKAFTFIAAQYLALTDKTLLIESDAEYHTITEFSTKVNVEATRIPMSLLYEDMERALDAIRRAEHNLVIIECIDRIDFDYWFISSLLYYNLMNDFTYIIHEMDLYQLAMNNEATVVVPSTVLDTLKTGEQIDRSLVPNIKFVGVNLNQLPEIHINSGVVMSKLLADVLSTTDIECPVVTINSLCLRGSTYDLGRILGRSTI